MKKFELTNEVMELGGKTLYRIRALRAIGTNVEAGDLGGWLEKDSNLSQEGNAWVCGNAEVCISSDILTIGPIGSRNGTTTFYRTKDSKIFVKCGCKNADIDTWLAMVKETHGDNKHAQAYRLAAEIARLQILGEKA